MQRGTHTLVFSFYNPETKTVLSKRLSLNSNSELSVYRQGMAWLDAQIARFENWVGPSGQRWSPQGRTRAQWEKWRQRLRELEGVVETPGEHEGEVEVAAQVDVPDAAAVGSMQPYTPPTIPENTGSTFLFVGSSKSGKTTFMKHFYDAHYRGQECVAVLFTPNLHAEIYRDLPKELVKGSRFHEKLIADAYKINKDTRNHYRFLFVLDDVVDEKENKVINKCYTIYRNSMISTLVSIQDPVLMKKTNRGQVNFVFFFRLNNNELIERAVKMWLSGYLSGRTLDEKVAHYKTLTRDHAFIYLDVLNNVVMHGRLQL